MMRGNTAALLIRTCARSELFDFNDLPQARIRRDPVSSSVATCFLEEAERVRDAVAVNPACAWRRDQMFIRSATPDDRRSFKHVVGFMVLPKAH
jgi:hypothetical protein